MGWYWMRLVFVCVTVTQIDAECHCASEAACVVFPSTPCSQVGDPDRCQEGWFGSYCQKQNIALRRSCSQSSTYLEATRFGARRGVDGTATTFFSDLTCTHTKNESNPTWTVNLNTSVPEKIQGIRFYLRQDYEERNDGMEILVDSQICYNWPSTEHPPPIANVTCRQPLTGTTVTIRIPGPLKFLTLCEVQIFVCSDGWFSEDCDKQCRCLNSTEICDKITGHCSSGCFQGYHGSDCQTVCRGGFYGVNCTSKCGNCLNGVTCNQTTGTCAKGCAAGWMNDDTKLCLQSCPDGSYGLNCASQCGNCLSGVICDKTTGSCPGGCAAGWLDDDTKSCQQPCPDGSYGLKCASQCGNCLSGVICDKSTGNCPGGCAAGWFYDDTQSCQQPCADGFYGNNCTSRCGYCFARVSCDKKNGTCPRGCAPGWVNDGTCLQMTRTVEGYSWGVPVAVVLSVVLIFTVIGATIYIRRLLKQLESLKNKTSEEHYLQLDEKTKVPATESTYEHMGNATPYCNTVDGV